MTSEPDVDRSPARSGIWAAPTPSAESDVVSHTSALAWSMPNGTGLGGEEPRDRCVPNTDWLRWQLLDSAFPTGGFAHSAGLEAAWQHGEIRNRDEFREWLVSSLHQVACGSLPWVTTANAEPSRLDALDRHCDAFTSNHVANRASRLQGRALLAAADRVFQARIPLPPFGHYGPLFGAITGALRFSQLEASRLFVFIHVRGAIAAAVRLNIVGSMDGQGLQFQIADQAEAVVQRGVGLTLEDLAQTAPLLDLWQGAQDRLYSRLFQS